MASTMMSQLLARPHGLSSCLPSRARVSSAVPRRVLICSAKQQEEEVPLAKKMALGSVAAALAAALLVGAAVPEDAMAARSGGRVGGSSFRSARPAPSAPRAAPRGGSTYNYYSAPPLIGGPVYGGGYGYGGGFGLPMIISPVFGFGGFFQFIVFMFVVSAVVNVVRGLSNRDRDDF